MNVRLVHEFRFEAAHFLPKVPPGHKCARMHGHSFKVEVAITGPVNPETGWLIRSIPSAKPVPIPMVFIKPGLIPSTAA